MFLIIVVLVIVLHVPAKVFNLPSLINPNGLYCHRESFRKRRKQKELLNIITMRQLLINILVLRAGSLSLPSTPRHIRAFIKTCQSVHQTVLVQVVTLSINLSSKQVSEFQRFGYQWMNNYALENGPSSRIVNHDYYAICGFSFALTLKRSR